MRVVFAYFTYFLFVFMLTGFTMVGVLGLHEFGHALTAGIEGCEGQRAVLYEKGYLPHAEIVCSKNENRAAIVFGGVLFPLVIAFIFFLTSELLLKEVSYLMAGFSLLFAYGDFQAYVPYFVNVIISLLALLIITISVIRLAIYKISHLDR